MGNRSSTPAAAPTARPPLLSAAVAGDVASFQSLWNQQDQASGVKDRQDNNVLHALFSCRLPSGKPDQILRLVHESLSSSSSTTQEEKELILVELYEARNELGCTPLWILIAYGNVSLLKQVVEMANNNEPQLKARLPTLVRQPNHQGDYPLLATCSQGNIDMVTYLASSEFLLDGQTMGTLLTQGNQKGTTPLQIVVANGHLELLKYLTDEIGLPLDQVWQVNAAGLSLFHICSERNFHQGLEVLLNYVVTASQSQADAALEKVLGLLDKNGANALHVACFCGNAETVQVWLDTIVQHATTTTAAVKNLLDRTDGQGRTAYWLGMVQGHEETIGQPLAAAGVDTQQPEKMVQEIAQARERRAAKGNTKPAVDANALLGR